MFGIGLPELIIIIIVALLVVGPAKLPEVARSLGKALGEFRRLADDVKETIEQEMTAEEEKKEEPAGQTEEQKPGEQAEPGALGEEEKKETAEQEEEERTAVGPPPETAEEEEELAGVGLPPAAGPEGLEEGPRLEGTGPDEQQKKV